MSSIRTPGPFSVCLLPSWMVLFTKIRWTPNFDRWTPTWAPLPLLTDPVQIIKTYNRVKIKQNKTGKYTKLDAAPVSSAPGPNLNLIGRYNRKIKIKLKANNNQLKRTPSRWRRRFPTIVRSSMPAYWSAPSEERTKLLQDDDDLSL